MRYSLPKNKFFDYFIFAVFALIILYVLKQFYNTIEGIKGVFSGGESGVQKETNAIETQKAIDNIDVDYSQILIPVNYVAVADLLYTSMNNATFNQNAAFKKVWDALNGLSSEQLKAVYKSFGLRINDTFNVGGLINNEKWDLSKWFVYEFSGTNLAKLRGKFQYTGIKF